MDLSAVLAGLAVAMALVAVAIALQRRPQVPAAVAGADVGAALEILRRSVEDTRVANAELMGQLRGEVQRALGATEQSLVTQTTATQRTLTDLSRQLGTLGEQSVRIGDLAKDIGSLQDLLRAPKPRGGFGELMLERLLQDCLPASAYEIQFTYRDGSRVDAIVRYGSLIVPIDSKFPSESYTQIALARDDADRRARRRAFLQHVRRHVDAVARYISPADSTIDYGFMYLPSEAIYFELTLGDATNDEPDILRYCADRNVIPASPNTLLAYLRVVDLGLRGLAISDGVRDVEARASQALEEAGRLREGQRVLGGHLENAQRRHYETAEALGRLESAIEGLAQVPLAAGGEQAELPLRVPSEPQ